MHKPLTALALALFFSTTGSIAQAKEVDDGFERFGEELFFEDEPVSAIEHPDWFKMSFPDLPEDLDEAREAGKAGLVVYFGQEHCAYCKALMEVNFGREDIARYTRKHFDVIAVDIWGGRTLTDLRGRQLTERQLAVREGTNFTPSLVFYAPDGSEALRQRGYYPPYQFKAALEYVAGGHYRLERYRDYLARAEGAAIFEEGGLSEEPFILAGPRVMDRSRMFGERPLLVFYEHGNCHACDLLHAQVVSRPEIVELMHRFDVEQLNLWGDRPVLTPAGEAMTERQWADALDLFYSPTLLFFDEFGREVFRVDSVAMFYRLCSVMQYVLSAGYEMEPNFQRWRNRIGR